MFLEWLWHPHKDVILFAHRVSGRNLTKLKGCRNSYLFSSAGICKFDLKSPCYRRRQLRLGSVWPIVIVIFFLPIFSCVLSGGESPNSSQDSSGGSLWNILKWITREFSIVDLMSWNHCLNQGLATEEGNSVKRHVTMMSSAIYFRANLKGKRKGGKVAFY